VSLVDLLRELVEIESPTGDTSEIQARMEDELRATGAHVEARGKHLYATLEGQEPPLLLLGHVDTVWPRRTLEHMPFRTDGDRAYGPGVFDMKGGLVVLVALKRTMRSESSSTLTRRSEVLSLGRCSRRRRRVPSPLSSSKVPEKADNSRRHGRESGASPSLSVVAPLTRPLPRKA
jgi:Peptidase family M20/M25/M40